MVSFESGCIGLCVYIVCTAWGVPQASFLGLNPNHTERSKPFLEAFYQPWITAQQYQNAALGVAFLG